MILTKAPSLSLNSVNIASMIFVAYFQVIIRPRKSLWYSACYYPNYRVCVPLISGWVCQVALAYSRPSSRQSYHPRGPSLAQVLIKLNINTFYGLISGSFSCGKLYFLRICSVRDSSSSSSPPTKYTFFPFRFSNNSGFSNNCTLSVLFL